MSDHFCCENTCMGYIPESKVNLMSHISWTRSWLTQNLLTQGKPIPLRVGSVTQNMFIVNNLVQSSLCWEHKMLWLLAYPESYFPFGTDRFTINLPWFVTEPAFWNTPWSHIILIMYTAMDAVGWLESGSFQQPFTQPWHWIRHINILDISVWHTHFRLWT